MTVLTYSSNMYGTYDVTFSVGGVRWAAHLRCEPGGGYSCRLAVDERGFTASWWMRRRLCRAFKRYRAELRHDAEVHGLLERLR